MAAHARFIPETARRIADPFFTKDLYISEYHLGQFVEKREQLLIEVIQGLDVHSKAALGLIYMRKDHLESPVSLQGSEPQALEQLGSTLGECITALSALKGSLVANVLADDQPVWRFKHPTIGDAYAATLAFSPDLLGIFLSGSSTDNLLAQVTCGNVGVEKAVVVPKTLFPAMIGRLREFSGSSKYKVGWMSSWDARWTLHRFLATRCSKDFLAIYLLDDPDLLNKVAEPGLSLSFSPEVKLAIRLHGFGLLPEEHRKKFTKKVATYAIEGEDLRAMKDTALEGVFTAQEVAELVQTVRTDLLPRLAEVRREVQTSHDSSESPDEHMQGIVETISTLKGRFGDDGDALKILEREAALAQKWIAETEKPEPKVSPRQFGAVEPSEGQHGTRSLRRHRRR
ncbi:MAG: hypothetical protein IPI03_08735 [Rubrivivax sp.]|nr:hypothetical protein [Rubrivivax sp.]